MIRLSDIVKQFATKTRQRYSLLPSQLKALSAWQISVLTRRHSCSCAAMIANNPAMFHIPVAIVIVPIVSTIKASNG